MNDDILKGKWSQIKGDVKQFFGKLTDDDLTRTEGNKDKLVGSLQERYGYSKDEAEQRWNDYAATNNSKWEQLKDDVDSAVDKLAKKISPSQ